MDRILCHIVVEKNIFTLKTQGGHDFVTNIKTKPRSSDFSQPILLGLIRTAKMPNI